MEHVARFRKSVQDVVGVRGNILPLKGLRLLDLSSVVLTQMKGRGPWDASILFAA